MYHEIRRQDKGRRVFYFHPSSMDIEQWTYTLLNFKGFSRGGDALETNFHSWAQLT